MRLGNHAECIPGNVGARCQHGFGTNDDGGVDVAVTQRAICLADGDGRRRAGNAVGEALTTQLVLNRHRGCAGIGHHARNCERMNDCRIAVFDGCPLQLFKKPGVQRIDGVRTSHADADINAGPGFLLGAGFEAGISQRLFDRSHGKLRRSIQASYGPGLPGAESGRNLRRQRIGQQCDD